MEKSKWYGTITTFDDRGHVSSNLIDTKVSDEKPEDVFESTKDKDVYIEWFDSYEEATNHVKEARRA